MTLFQKIIFFFGVDPPQVPKMGGECGECCFRTVCRNFSEIRVEFPHENIRPTAILSPDSDSTQNFDQKFRVARIYRSNLQSFTIFPISNGYAGGL